MLHRQDVVACGDSGATHDGHGLMRFGIQDRSEILPDSLGCKKVPISIHVVLKREIDRSWNVARDPIYGFIFAGVALWVACID